MRKDFGAKITQKLVESEVKMKQKLVYFHKFTNLSIYLFMLQICKFINFQYKNPS